VYATEASENEAVVFVDSASGKKPYMLHPQQLAGPTSHKHGTTSDLKHLISSNLGRAWINNTVLCHQFINMPSSE
jgi:hypothetical protein